MKQARSGLGGWRLTIVMLGLVSLLMTALPAQAGLGDLLAGLLDPVEDLPVVGDIAEPIIEDVVDPVVEDVVDPLVTPIVDTIVTPIVEEVVTPALNNVVAPVIEPVVETIPPVGTTTTTAPILGTSTPDMSGESAGFGVSSSGSPGGILLANSNNDGEPGAVQATAELHSLEAALALQAALVDGDSAEVSNAGATQPGEIEVVDAGWLDGLTNWLRNSADGLLNVLALPIRLLELLARALLTAGSGLVAPLSMLLAFTAIQMKDRRWGRAKSA